MFEKRGENILISISRINGKKHYQENIIEKKEEERSDTFLNVFRKFADLGYYEIQ